MIKHLRIAFVFVCLIFILFYQSSTAKENNRYLNLQIFAKVLNLVQDYYVDKVDIKKIIYGGVKGMLHELDPHTNLLTPEIFKEFQSETAGEFGGLGIELTVDKDNILTIISPIEDAPAWKAGILPGDKIMSINGQPTKGFTLVEAAKLMKGKNGQVISLGIMREGFVEPKVFKVTRGVVKIKSVKSVNLDPGYYYIRINSFVENTSRELEKKLKKMTKKEPIKGLILDFRQNPGGLLDQAVKVSDLFLKKGIIVSTIGRDKKARDIVYAHESGTYSGFPIVSLIDEYSASASEIVTGALKDNKRALVVGRRSFGKGSVQSVIKLGDGSGLKLTVARYYTPSGKSIQAEGVHPDIVLEKYDRDKLLAAKSKGKVKRESDIKGHLGAEKKKKGVQKKRSPIKLDRAFLMEDYQVSQAYKYLKTWKVFKTLNL